MNLAVSKNADKDSDPADGLSAADGSGSPGMLAQGRPNAMSKKIPIAFQAQTKRP